MRMKLDWERKRIQDLGCRKHRGYGGTRSMDLLSQRHQECPCILLVCIP
ncbi:hypothetical protein OIU76_019376 [Salix suchowensis]|nr:hypothetical protein OIU76_019376 [Salix suchowensis]